MADLLTIKKIRTGAGDHLIDATYVNGRLFTDVYDELQGMVHGAIDTYVIPTSKNSGSTATAYGKIVNSSESSVTVTKTELNSLVNPSNASGTYKVGDVILVEEISDNNDKNTFDRWVSAVSGNNVTLTVLETQVATHHHTITTGSAKALTGVTPTSTSNVMAKVGTSVTVINGGSGDVVTSVSYDDKGSDTLTLATGTSDSGIGHSHTVNSHSHSVSVTGTTLVSQKVDAYTSLTSKNFTPHTHTTVDVAGAHVDGEEFAYANGQGNTDVFIKKLKDSSAQTTSSVSLTTGTNTDGLTTSAQTSGDSVGEIVKTTSSGAHTHSVSVTTDVDVVKTVTLAAKPLTSVKLTHSPGTIQTKVVTGVTYASKDVIESASLSGTTSFFNSCSVVDDGVLTFNTSSVTLSTSSVTVASISSVASASQTASSATITVDSVAQSHTSGKVASTGSAAEAGAHTHGFSHTHSIPAHTHGIDKHSHTYVKSVVDTSGSAYISLSTSSYKPHTHTNTNVVGTVSNDTAITYIESGTTTEVVRTLKSKAETFTAASAAPGTDTKYYKLDGDIVFPGLKIGSVGISTMLSTTSITPAASSGETPIKAITPASADFINSVTAKTSENKGGK